MKRADSNQKTLLVLFFVLAGLLVLRYCAYGLSYYPQLDDYIQYHNYRHSPTSFWEMAQASGVGLTVDLKKVPLRQETVEICEFFDLNPYQLISSGSMLMACDRGYDVVEALRKEGIRASVVGKFTDSHDKIIHYDENETRYLEPPKPDELYKVETGQA